MILQRVESSDFLSNAYLIVDEPGGHGVLVDSNGAQVTEPLVERVEREGTEITHVLLTHHHWDHVLDADALAEGFGVPVLAHPKAAELLEGKVTDTIEEGDVVESGELRIEVLETPGHCADHLALVVDGTDCLTADVIFKGTVGGTRAPGATGFEDLKSSIMDKLMKLPPETRIHPGHRGPSTIGDEWERNPFIRIWRGLDEESAEPVSLGPADAEEREEAALVLWAPDYDGGNKAWVRLADGSDAIVGGSQVKREG
jgi:glyoxylase-like metal-dependent hydrolase (beta-lactamase superfamily II)